MHRLSEKWMPETDLRGQSLILPEITPIQYQTYKYANANHLVFFQHNIQEEN